MTASHHPDVCASARILALVARSYGDHVVQTSQCPRCRATTVQILFANVGDDRDLFVPVEGSERFDLDDNGRVIVDVHRCPSTAEDGAPIDRLVADPTPV